MTDVVVTVPKPVWAEWLAEGDAAGDRATGQEYDFSVALKPEILPKERVYVVAHNRLRGYAPLVRVETIRCGAINGYVLVRAGGAVAVTIPGLIPGFRGFRYRWWDPALEQAFPEWRTP